MAVETRDENRGDSVEEAPSDQPQQPQAPARHPLQLPISPEMEDQIVAIVRADYDASMNARNKKDYGRTSKGESLDFTKWLKAIRDLYNGQREPKTIPWKNCSNRSLRIATSILDMLHARLLPTIINEDLLRWKAGEAKDVPKVDRISKLMKWWLWVRCHMRYFFDSWAKTLIGYGDAFTESFWKVDIKDTGETINEPVMDQMGNQIDTMTYRNITRIESASSRVYQKEKVFLQEGSRDIQKEPVVLEDSFRFRELEDGEASGKYVNVSNLLRQKLAEGVDTGHASLSEEERQRIVNLRIRNVPVTVYKEYLEFDADGDGFAEQVRVYVSLEHDLYLGGIAINNLTKTGERPIDFGKFDSRFNRPEENDGEGILEKVKELAEEIDAIFNAMTDANSLSILRPGFYDPTGDLDAPVLRLAPNKMTPVADPNRNVLFPDLSINIAPLMDAIRLVLEFIERLTAASAYAFGKESEVVGGSGTATRTNAITQAADIRFAIPAQRLREAATAIMRRHLDLLQKNIPPGLENRVLGEKGEPIFGVNELTEEGISGEYDAYLLPDPSMGSKQLERDLAGMFYSILLQNVIVGTDPAKIYKVTADLIKSWDKDPEEYLGPAPNLDDIDDPADENTLLVQGDFTRVRAQIAENHIQHMKVHQDLLNSPTLLFIQERSPNLFQEIVMAVQSHIMEHQQMMQVMMALVSKFGGGSSGSGLQPDVGGGQGGNPETNQGAPNAAGMEQAPGPLGTALDKKRRGESQATPRSEPR